MVSGLCPKTHVQKQLTSPSQGVGADCLSNDGKSTPKLMPQFPSSCPYITSVGGTQAFKPEISWVASSGGFSEYFPQPWYQKDAVAAYLDSKITPAMKAYLTPYVNFAGRGFPDISGHSLSPAYVPTRTASPPSPQTTPAGPKLTKAGLRRRFADTSSTAPARRASRAGPLRRRPSWRASSAC